MVVVNPYATATSPRMRRLVARALDHRYEVEVVETEAPGHAVELAARAVGEGFDGLVVVGGDGTVNEAANGLAGSSTALIPLPGGATNVYHRLVGMPVDIVEATQHVLGLADRWAPRRVDLGRLGDRWFTFSAGLGLDASVVRRVNARPGAKARLGPWFFAATAVATFLRRYVAHPPRLILTLADGHELRGATAVLQNADSYTFFARTPVSLVHGVELASGRMRGAVLRRTTPTVMPGVTVRALIPRLDLTRLRAVDATGDLVSATVRSADGRPLPAQVDGDYLGLIESAEIAVGAGALTVLS